ncbi:hypothetical protein OSB04_006604 [Centaurea solstitialis]|uniref:Uncharacterized protein n=1 Tax=Centaurea solstitialis TaxID=347529 RepID=A0AA38TK08_9ASTR|nr:hypothetical protein OSB04_006604 [Centaurea solstitialis]
MLATRNGVFTARKEAVASIDLSDARIQTRDRGNTSFLALDITGKNYLSWVLDAEIHVDAKGLGKTIKEGNQESIQDRAKAIIFLRHHLHEALKTEYLTIKDPLILWKNLRGRYDHQRTVILPKARYEWVHLRFRDFKSVSEYNSAMFRITSQLTLCGEKITDEEMLEKTSPPFTLLICFCNNNIVKGDLRNIVI